jgi:hypothetical protein
VPRSLATHAASSDAMKLALDHGQQAPERGLVPVPPRLQQRGYIA